ncbi:MAG: YajD family HNH nuclease [Desulfomonilaceae bacterium]
MRGPKKPKSGAVGLDRILGEAQREREIRAAGYRDRALKIYPPICGRCGREFSGRRLRELTVHHKDHNHDNNPPDGSNWELLCIYCHDMEHQRYVDEENYGDESKADERDSSSSYRPFANLQDLLKDKK